MKLKRGQIIWADLGKSNGSKQSGIRPCVIVQNNVGNKYSSTTIVAPMTGEIKKIDMPTHVVVTGYEGITSPSMIMLEQLATVDEVDIIRVYDLLSTSDMKKVNKAILISVGVSR